MAIGLLKHEVPYVRNWLGLNDWEDACPWIHPANINTEVNVCTRERALRCERLFPKVRCRTDEDEGTSCPCYEYDAKYVRRRVRKWLKEWD